MAIIMLLVTVYTISHSSCHSDLKKKSDKANDCKCLWIKIPPGIIIRLHSGRNANLPLAQAHKFPDKFQAQKYPGVIAFEFHHTEAILESYIPSLLFVIVTIFNANMKL